jgi:ribosome-binding factor A
MRRVERVKELILRELGKIIRREFDISPKIFITITEIVLSDDFSNAKVMVSIFPDKNRDEIFKELSLRAHEIRQFLGKRLPNLHPLPFLTFELDDRVRTAARVEELIEKFNNKK